MGSPLDVLAVGLDPGELPGCRVEMAEDLLGALARLADGGTGLVLLSVDLPDGPGVDAVRAIRERAPDVPVIAIAVTEDQRARAIGAGARDALPADADRGLLLRAVRYATEIARLEAELERVRTVDGLTGLPNARGLEQIARRHLRLADRSGASVRLVLIRLEAPEGADEPDPDQREAFIAETAGVLRGVVRQADVLARVDEETFCLMLAGDASGTQALVLSRLVEAVAAANARGGRTTELRLSVGAATYDPEDPVTFTELMEEADRRLRRPEASG